MKHGSLFTGIGGFDLAAQRMGWENVFHCEVEDHLRKFLKLKWPNAKSFGNIKNADFNQFSGKIDVLSGGFPCQNISAAGKKEGLHGAKSQLWFEMFRAVSEIRPRFVLAENSNQITKKGLEIILFQLAQIGYDAEWETFWASEFGFDHRRARTYFLAYPTGEGWKGILQGVKGKCRESNQRQINEALDSFCNPFLRFEEVCGKSPIFGVDDGLPNRLDIVPRLSGCGNAIIPEIAFQIFKEINNHV